MCRMNVPDAHIDRELPIFLPYLCRRLCTAITGVVLLASLLCAGPGLRVANAAGTAEPIATATLPILPQASDPISLLDEVGKLAHPVSTDQVAEWKREVNTPNLPAARTAHIHLLLGEWELAANEQPDRAQWHFRQAETLLPVSDFSHAQARYDIAISLFYQGAYAESADAFHSLMTNHARTPSFDCRACALWLRYAEISAGYHRDHARLGIPEPPRLDPRCGAAALAACLRGLSRPYDEATLLANCRVTGEGSNLQDLLNAAVRLGADPHVVPASDETLHSLPKPLVAFVEHDHFVAVTTVDKSGVTYLCSDCGAWPGGSVHLSWAQWDVLSPSTYITVEVFHPRILASQSYLNQSSIRIASTGNLDGLVMPSHLVSSPVPSTPKKPIVTDYQPVTTVGCGGRPNGLRAPPFASSPTDGDPVNLATGEEELRPPPDLVSYNPNGPSVVWQRVYDSLRGDDGNNVYNNVDFGDGWSQSYNIGVNDPSATVQQIAQGATATLSAGTPVNGSIGTTAFWKIVSSADGTTTYGSNSSPQGWNVSTPDGINVTITAPASAATSTGLGTGYENSQYWAQVSDGKTYNVYAYFNIASAGSPSGTVCTMGTKYLILDNGSRVGFNALGVPTASNQKVACTALTGGTPYLLEWDYDPTNVAGYYTITFPDRTRWTTTRVSELVSDNSFSFVSSLAQITDRNGNSLLLHYQGLFKGSPELASITDAGSGTTLLAVSRSTSGSVPYIVSVTDAYGRSVYYQNTTYQFGSLSYFYYLSQVSQIVLTGTANPPSRANYGYQNPSGFNGLSTITAPSPTGTGTTTTTLAYSNFFVSSVTDSEGVSRNYSALDANRTQVTVNDSSGHTAYTYSILFDNNLNEINHTDGNGHVISQSTYADPNDAYRPSSIVDGNNLA